jgi:hypothetical protein
MGACSRWMGNSLLKATIVDVQVWFTVVTSVGREVRLGIDAYPRAWPLLEKRYELSMKSGARKIRTAAEYDIVRRFLGLCRPHAREGQRQR